MARWLDLPADIDYGQDYRDHLIRLLLTTTTTTKKKRLRELPHDEAECLRLLSQWLRCNTLPNGKDVAQRHMYRILAVDGFDGLEAKDLKNYVSSIWNPTGCRLEYRLHGTAVRDMYDWIDASPEVSSLTGTDSACVVFLALLELYGQHLSRVMMDDEVAHQTQRARLGVEGFLHRNASYYKDVRKVNEVMLKTLGLVYSKRFEQWQKVGSELLTALCHKRLAEKERVESDGVVGQTRV